MRGPLAAPVVRSARFREPADSPRRPTYARSMRGVRGGIGPVAGSVLAALAMVTAAHLAAQLRGAWAVADATQVMLMPLLLVVLLAGSAPPRGRLVGLFALGLVLSWAGDAVPRFLEGQGQFLAMLGSFLLAQLVYAIALWPLRSDSLLAGVGAGAGSLRGGRAPGEDGAAGGPRRGAVLRRAAMVPYAVAGSAIVVLCAPVAGALLPALGLYAAAICTMAVLATGLGRRGVIGGALFVVSDALIALDTFDVLTLPAHAFWVMLTYVAAQLLLVLGVLDREGPRCGAGARVEG